MNFDLISDLLEVDGDYFDNNPDVYGYKMCFVSVFDHWLSQKEFEDYFPDKNKNLIQKHFDYNFKRRLFYRSIPGKKYIVTDKKFVYKSDNKYFDLIDLILAGHTLNTFYIKDLDIVIDGGYEQTDTIYYRSNRSLEFLKNKAAELGLYILYRKKC